MNIATGGAVNRGGRKEVRPDVGRRRLAEKTERFGPGPHARFTLGLHETLD